MKSTTQERKIAAMIQPAIADLGFNLVQVRVIGSQKLQTLQIMAENPATGKLDLNGCTAISRSISAILDVEDPISSAYQLEVSSPGMDRPLTKPEDFEKYNGEHISVETEEADEDGQKRFRGIITGFGDDIVTLTTDLGTKAIELGNIVKAKLVLTDELVKAALKHEIKE
jgi:ribosome maturation factor RimP